MQTRKLVERLRGEHQASKASGPAWLKKSQRAVLQLAESHPQQMGAMLPLLLNYLLVAPGEAFYVAPCEPHAYVAGECVEVCACSDNFVRIGLSQNIDAEAAITLLSYETGGPDVGIWFIETPGPGHYALEYAPDVADFEARVTTVEPGGCFELSPSPCRPFCWSWRERRDGRPRAWRPVAAAEAAIHGAGDGALRHGGHAAPGGERAFLELRAAAARAVLRELGRGAQAAEREARARETRT